MFKCLCVCPTSKISNALGNNISRRTQVKIDSRDFSLKFHIFYDNQSTGIINTIHKTM